MNKSDHPHFHALFASLIWGSTGVVVKYLNLPPTTITYFRFAVPVTILAIFFKSRNNGFPKLNNKLMLFTSILNAVRMPFYFASFLLTSIANAVIILYTWPIFVTIFSAIFLKERITRRNITQILLAFIGIIIIYSNKQFSFEDKDFLGMSLGLLSALTYSFTVIIYKRESQKYSKYEIIWYQNLVGAFAFLPFPFFNRPFLQPGQLFLLTGYGGMIGLIGFAFFFSALKKIKASVTALFTYFEVISAMTLGMVFFKETLTGNIIFGGLLIIGSTVMQIEKNKNHRNGGGIIER